MAKTLGRDNILGSNVIVGRGFEFRARSGAEDYLVKWTGTTGTTKAKVAGDGTMKVYQDPTTNDDVTRKLYDISMFFPYEGGSLNGDIDLQGAYKIINSAAATADGDAVSRASADARFLKQTDAATTYLTQASAASNYLTQASASSTYLTQASASTNYATKSQLSSYATVSQLSSYAPASGSSNYAPSSGSANYAPSSGSANYLPTANPTFTGKMNGPVFRPDYTASPTVPLSSSTTSGIVFDAGARSPGGLIQGPTYMYLVAPDYTSAGVNFLKNKSTGAIEYVPCYGSSFTNPSELALKNILERLTGALEKVAVIEPLVYAMKNDPGQTRQWGFTVENVEPVAPEVVSQGEFHKGIDYGRMVTLAIAAIKELTTRVEALEARA